MNGCYGGNITPLNLGGFNKAGKAIGRSIYFELADPIYPWFESFEYKLTKTP
jgi:hypothetical protein